jgi:hypothetical protein
MNLTERLERAKLERDLASGKVTSDSMLPPERADEQPEPEVTAEPIRTEPFRPEGLQIEVGPTGLASVVDTPVPDGPIFGGGVPASADGAPSRCPSCNRIGRVDMVDLVGHRTHLTCDGCGAMWHVYDESS